MTYRAVLNFVIALLALWAMFAIGKFALDVWERNQPTPAPDESELHYMPNGFVAHTDTKFISTDSSDTFEPTTYVVVDTPYDVEESIERLILAYEWRGDWKQRASNNGSMGRKSDGSCLRFRSKDEFVANNSNTFEGRPIEKLNQDRIDWANQTVTKPDRQLIISLGCF